MRDELQVDHQGCRGLLGVNERGSKHTVFQMNNCLLGSSIAQDAVAGSW